MNATQRMLTFSLLVFLILSGCDAVDSEVETETTDLFAVSPEEVQVDYSHLDDETVAQLMSGPSLGKAQLQGFQMEGAVFTMSNAPEGNDILSFERDSDGRLAPGGTYPTEGLGTGDGLNGTSNPMALALGNQYLYAVNGGSNDISIFSVNGAALQFVGKVPSRGPRPISVTVHERLLYVLNAGSVSEPGNIAGFRIGDGGMLYPILPGIQPLAPGAVNTSQIQFDPRGLWLVVTDKATNTIATYRINRRRDGRAKAPNVQPSHGQTAFGFAFNFRSRLLVSEAFGGAPDASAVSSYRLRGGNAILNTASESVPTMQTAACWVETFGSYAFTTNTGSSSVTAYRVFGNGVIERIPEDGIAVTTGEGSQPLDMDIALNYLYIHSAGTNRLSVYSIGAGGSLASVSGGAVDGLPPTAVGVAAF